MRSPAFDDDVELRRLRFITSLVFPVITAQPRDRRRGRSLFVLAEWLGRYRISDGEALDGWKMEAGGTKP